ncbi:MAG TPA: NrdJb [Rhodanobacteraceae bacterium]
MPVSIKSKIVGYEVVEAKPTPKPVAPAPAPALAPAAAPVPSIVQMHEKIERPEALLGETFKIKSPLFDHALYVTINDMVLNRGTQYEVRRPFEIFINSKNMEQFQWIVALTRVMSAVFRKGGDCTFLVEELRAVFDPRGGYFKPGGTFMPSIVAELGSILRTHLINIGLMAESELESGQRELILEKKAELAKREQAHAHVETTPASTVDNGQGKFPPNARVCGKCHAKALIRMDNCDTCLNCGASKCG